MNTYMIFWEVLPLGLSLWIKKVSLKFIMHPHGNSFNFLWLIKHEYVKSVFSLCRCSGVLVLVCLFVCLFVYWCY